MMTLTGLATSRGIANGTIFKLAAATAEPAMRTIQDTDGEVQRAMQAIDTLKQRLQLLYEKTVESAGEEAAAIFEIHGMMLEDEDFLDNIHDIITQESLCASYAVFATGKQFSDMFIATGDEYMQQRAADVVDLCGQLETILAGGAENPFAGIEQPVIVAAEELMPSQTVQLDKKMVLGFISKRGSTNSHASILARSLGIPAVSCLGDGYDTLQDGDEVILDGIDGCVIVSPTQDMRMQFHQKMSELAHQNEQLKALAGLPAQTRDGACLELCANIGTPEEVDMALACDAEGIGLFRSEFLYLESNEFPDEEMQFEAYKTALHRMNGKRVVVRTLDLGADKQAPYFNIPNEENPALGYRAIRICLNQPEIFETQLRALLRASVFGRLAIMFPMVTSETEVRLILQVVNTVKSKLDTENIPYAKDIEYGIMIETPAAVMVADRLAKLVDFFSIGTNDLTQYTFAADRMNTKVSYLFDAGSVSILRMIREVVRRAHESGIWVGICGESAADLNLIPYYIAMGIDELSMSAQSILRTKETIRKLKKEECEAQADAFLN